MSTELDRDLQSPDRVIRRKRSIARLEALVAARQAALAEAEARLETATLDRDEALENEGRAHEERMKASNTGWEAAAALSDPSVPVQAIPKLEAARDRAAEAYLRAAAKEGECTARSNRCHTEWREGQRWAKECRDAAINAEAELAALLSEPPASPSLLERLLGGSGGA